MKLHTHPYHALEAPNALGGDLHHALLEDVVEELVLGQQREQNLLVVLDPQVDLLVLHRRVEHLVHVGELVRLVQHVVDERVHLHVVGNVSRAVRNQHVAVRIGDEVRNGRELVVERGKVLRVWEHYGEGKREEPPLGITEKTTSFLFFT